MININSKKKLQIMIFVFIAVITLGVGYAAISAINLVISGNSTSSVNQNNFSVVFKSASVTTGTGTASINNQDATIAYFDVSGLSAQGDTVVATYTIKNESAGVGAEISLGITNSNSEYFQVTERVEDNKLQAGDTTTATITVTMIKTPLENEVSTNITGTLTAFPLENTNAAGGTSASKIAGEPESFATDSWATIKKAVQDNNTSAYNVGDTKIVEIWSSNYTLRIANKTTGEHCGDNDTTYSQTACGFVVEFAEIVAHRKMNSSSTNIGGYPETQVYDYLKNTLYGRLPEDLQSAIKPTRVISSHGSDDSANFITIDNLYILSGVEVFGTDDRDTAASTTTQLEYYVGKSNSDIIIQYNSSNSLWWLRSADSNNSNSFRCVSNSGDLTSYTAGWNANGVVPAFRIG